MKGKIQNKHSFVMGVKEIMRTCIGWRLHMIVTGKHALLKTRSLWFKSDWRIWIFQDVNAISGRTSRYGIPRFKCPGLILTWNRKIRLQQISSEFSLLANNLIPILMTSEATKKKKDVEKLVSKINPEDCANQLALQFRIL